MVFFVDSGVIVFYFKENLDPCVNRLKAIFLHYNQLDALIFHIYSWNETLHVSDNSSVHHQEFFTVHTAVVYVIQVC